MNHYPFAKLAFTLLLLAVSGCTTIESKSTDWARYKGPGAGYFLQEEVSFVQAEDFGEPTNRWMWEFNNFFFRYLGGPAAALWEGILPQFARTGIYNAGQNLLYPGRLVSNLLQGKGSEAWAETHRFLVNSTYGVLGLIDQTGDTPPESDEDFGQTFEKAGWEQSSFVVLPFFGPSTVRDSVGIVLDSVVDPASYFFPAVPVRAINETSSLLMEYERLEASTYDLYHLAQFLKSLQREIDLEDYVHDVEDCEFCVATETIQAVFLSFRDPSFPALGQDFEVPLKSSGHSLPYTLFLQPQPAPIVYILPGLGGHRLSNSALGLAEMVYQHGFSVVTISSAMNFEFIENGSTVDLPGFAPVDAHDVHLALDAIHHEIESKFQQRVTSHVLMGMSLGAFHTLFIAAAEKDSGQNLVAFDRYVAINPPVRLEYGLHQLDAFFNAPLQAHFADQKGVIQHTLRKALDLGEGSLTPSIGLPFSDLEAQFLIGLSFRSTLQDVIFQTQLRHNMGVLKTELSASQRAPAYQEISEFSYIEYLYAFLLPYYAGLRDDITYDEAGAKRLMELSDLHAIGEGLRLNDHIHLVTNEDDFLLGPEDLVWLGGVLGQDRCYHSKHGGHMGTLYRPEVQATVMAPILDLLPAASNH